MTSRFVDAFVKRTGEKVRVPSHFFDFPRLSHGLSKTPRQRATEAAASKSPKTPAAGETKE